MERKAEIDELRTTSVVVTLKAVVRGCITFTVAQLCEILDVAVFKLRRHGVLAMRPPAVNFGFRTPASGACVFATISGIIAALQGVADANVAFPILLRFHSIAIF
jgi:hypothetical protein